MFGVLTPFQVFVVVDQFHLIERDHCELYKFFKNIFYWHVYKVTCKLIDGKKLWLTNTQPNLGFRAKFCRNFGKEPVILFHRSAAAPWGSRGVHYKKEPHSRFSLFLVPLPQLLASGPFRSSPLMVYVFWYLPSPGTQERRTHVQS